MEYSDPSTTRQRKVIIRVPTEDVENKARCSFKKKEENVIQDNQMNYVLMYEAEYFSQKAVDQYFTIKNITHKVISIWGIFVHAHFRYIHKLACK